MDNERLLRGGGAYVDDLDAPGLREVALVRSIHAHAQVLQVDLSRAASMPGLVAVCPAQLMEGLVPSLVNTEELRVPPLVTQHLEPVVKVHPMALPAASEVTFVGEPLAAVLNPEAVLLSDTPRVLVDEPDTVGMRCVMARSTWWAWTWTWPWPWAGASTRKVCCRTRTSWCP